MDYKDYLLDRYLYEKITNQLPDYDEEDLELEAEEFCKKYNCPKEEYEQIQKEYQEM